MPEMVAVYQGKPAIRAVLTRRVRHDAVWQRMTTAAPGKADKAGRQFGTGGYEAEYSAAVLTQIRRLPLRFELQKSTPFEHPTSGTQSTRRVNASGLSPASLTDERRTRSRWTERVIPINGTREEDRREPGK
jgi:hypothetical protein